MWRQQHNSPSTPVGKRNARAESKCLVCYAKTASQNISMWIIYNLVLAKAIKTGLYPNDATNKLAELDITPVFHARTAKHVTEERLVSFKNWRKTWENKHAHGALWSAELCNIMLAGANRFRISSLLLGSGHCLKLCAKNIWFRFCYVACVPYNPWIRHMDVAKGYGGTKRHALHMRPMNSASARARVQGPPCSVGGKIPSI